MASSEVREAEKSAHSELANGNASCVVNSSLNHADEANSKERQNNTGNRSSYRWKDINCKDKLQNNPPQEAKSGEVEDNQVRVQEVKTTEENKNSKADVKELECVHGDKSRARILKKSYTLPTQLNGVVGIKRNQKHIFKSKMEVLTEGEPGCNEVPPLVLGEIPADVKSPGNERHSKRKSSKQEVTLPHLPNKQSSPRCLMPVCPNHDGRNGGETLEAVLYCGACVLTVCYKCAFEKHKDHNVTPIQVAAESIRANLAERKRRIENTISQMRAKRKSVETSNDEIQQRIHAQFEQVAQRLRKKEDEVMSEIVKMKQKRSNLIHGVQNQQETAWGQIDAVLKTQDDVKMLEEYNGLTLIDFKLPEDSPTSSPLDGDNGLLKKDTPRPTLDLNRIQDEIEKIRLNGHETDSSVDGSDVVIPNGVTPRQTKKRFAFKLDSGTAHSALRVSSNQTSVEYIGAERNSVTMKHPNASLASLSTGTNPYHPKYPSLAPPNGMNGRLKRTQFATVLGDSSITQGKQYWEVSVNRSMEYRLGVAYKHMQGTKTLADEHNCWALCLTYPDRYSAIHKHHKEYIFVPTHTAAQATKVIRIGIFLDYERGVLSFYNASTAAEKRHLYTFRTFFNRPVWPLLSLRQGKLQVLTGLPVPRNLVWKTR